MDLQTSEYHWTAAFQSNLRHPIQNRTASDRTSSNHCPPRQIKGEVKVYTATNSNGFASPSNAGTSLRTARLINEVDHSFEGAWVNPISPIFASPWSLFGGSWTWVNGKRVGGASLNPIGGICPEGYSAGEGTGREMPELHQYFVDSSLDMSNNAR